MRKYVNYLYMKDYQSIASNYGINLSVETQIAFYTESVNFIGHSQQGATMWMNKWWERLEVLEFIWSYVASELNGLQNINWFEFLNKLSSKYYVMLRTYFRRYLCHEYCWWILLMREVWLPATWVIANSNKLLFYLQYILLRYEKLTGFDISQSHGVSMIATSGLLK